METTVVQTNIKKECPVQKIAGILSDTWTMLILRDLTVVKKRFCELEKSLVGISTRTLTLKLKTLQDEEIVTHKDSYYSLTKKGQKLKPVIKELEKVGKHF